MRGPLLLAVCLLAVSAGCREKERSVAAEQNSTPVPAFLKYEEAGNVVSLAEGAVVTSRTGELNLSSTPMHALDSQLLTAWSTPPGDPQQSCVISLAAPTLIDHAVLSNAGVGGGGAKRIRIDYSTDGLAFSGGTTVEVSRADSGQKLPIPPATVRALRLTLLDSLSPSDTITVPTLEFRGRVTAPSAEVDPSGTWRVDDRVLHLQRSGNRLFGQLSGKMPLHLYGSMRGNVGRFVWTRVNQYGYGFITFDPSLKALNALLWYEKPIQLFSAPAWFGISHTPNNSFNMLPLETMVGVGLHVTRRFSAFDVRFADAGNVADPESADTIERLARFAAENSRYNFQLVSYFFSGDQAADAKRTDTRLENIRALLASKQLLAPNLELVSSGGRIDTDAPTNALDRQLYDRIDLVITGPRS